MSWHYKSPMTFPARFPIALQEAALTPNQSILLGAYDTREAALDLMESFRWYKWCLKQKPEVNFTLSNYLEQFDFRCRLREAAGAFSVDLIAREKVIESLKRLNPGLRELIARECQ